MVFGSAMTVCILIGITDIRRRDFISHGEWMIRAYAIAMGAGTQVLTHLPLFISVGAPGTLGRAVAMGAGWVVNVIVAELVIRRARDRRADATARNREHAAMMRRVRAETAHAN
jgi:hypothetical protein